MTELSIECRPPPLIFPGTDDWSTCIPAANRASLRVVNVTPMGILQPNAPAPNSTILMMHYMTRHLPALKSVGEAKHPKEKMLQLTLTTANYRPEQSTITPNMLTALVDTIVTFNYPVDESVDDCKPSDAPLDFDWPSELFDGLIELDDLLAAFRAHSLVDNVLLMPHRVVVQTNHTPRSKLITCEIGQGEVNCGCVGEVDNEKD